MDLPTAPDASSIPGSSEIGQTIAYRPDRAIAQTFLSIESGSENNGNDQNRESNSDTDNRLDHGWLYSCKAVTNIMVAFRRRQNVDTAMPDRGHFYTALRQQQELPGQI